MQPHREPKSDPQCHLRNTQTLSSACLSSHHNSLPIRSAPTGASSATSATYFRSTTYIWSATYPRGTTHFRSGTNIRSTTGIRKSTNSQLQFSIRSTDVTSGYTHIWPPTGRPHPHTRLCLATHSRRTTMARTTPSESTQIHRIRRHLRKSRNDTPGASRRLQRMQEAYIPLQT